MRRNLFAICPLLAVALVVSAAPSQAQEKPPAPSAPRKGTLPIPTEKTLANGLRVIVVSKPGTGLVSAQLLVKTGAAADPKDKAGLADFTASLLTRGTATRSAPQIAEAIEALGGNLSASAGWDSATVSLGVMRTNLEPALAVMADVLRNPAFSGEEIDRLRTEELDNLEVSLRSPGTLAGYASSRLVYGDSPYGHPRTGTPESLKRIARPDIAAFHAQFYRPESAVLVFGGDITSDDAYTLAQKVLGDWKATAPYPDGPAPAPLPRASMGRVLVIDKPDAGQAAVLVTLAGIKRADPDLVRGEVANNILSGYSGRLNQEVRVKRGLSYGAGSSLSARVLGGSFSATSQTKNSSAAEVASLLVEQLKGLADNPLAATELTPRKASLSGNYSSSLETGGGLAGEVAELALYGEPLSNLDTYLSRIEGVTGDQVKAFARTHIPATNANVVIVGDAKQFLPDLKKRFKNVEVIPVSKLDLNQASLKKP